MNCCALFVFYSLGRNPEETLVARRETEATEAMARTMSEADKPEKSLGTCGAVMALIAARAARVRAAEGSESSMDASMALMYKCTQRYTESMERAERACLASRPGRREMGVGDERTDGRL